MEFDDIGIYRITTGSQVILFKKIIIFLLFSVYWLLFWKYISLD